MRTNVFALLARLTLAAVFGYAAVTKIGDPAGTVRAVRAYDLLPDSLATALGRGLPAAELTLALLLLTGVAVRVVATIAAGFLLMFLVGIVSADVRGLTIDCGCFGGGGSSADASYTVDIVRDLLLLALAVGLAVLGRSAFAIGPRRPAAPAPVDEKATGSERRRQRAAHVRHDHAVRRHRTVTRYLAVGAAALVASSAVAGIAVAAATAAAPPTAVPSGVTAKGGILVGSPAARTTVVAYEDPQCPVCAEFEGTAGRVLADAVASGAVKVEYRMRSFLGPESIRAVAALGAAQDEGRFEQLREQLFAHQPKEHTGGFTIDDLLSLGASAGLTSDRYVDAVRSQKYASWARQADDQASRDGNVGTPALVVDGSAVSNAVAFDPDALARLLRAPGATTRE